MITKPVSDDQSFATESEIVRMAATKQTVVRNLILSHNIEIMIVGNRRKRCKL